MTVAVGAHTQQHVPHDLLDHLERDTLHDRQADSRAVEDRKRSPFTSLFIEEILPDAQQWPGYYPRPLFDPVPLAEGLWWLRQAALATTSAAVSEIAPARVGGGYSS